jgi:D-alanyl-D-alanine carboxypeptidase
MGTVARWRRNFLSHGRAALLTLPLLAPLSLGMFSPAAAQARLYNDRFSSILEDAANGKVLEAVDPNAPRHPASLAKLMTLYLTFEALRDHRITLNTPVPVSPHAASMQPTKLGLLPGMHVTVEQCILGIVTRSANDAASALGELLGGSEDRFAQMMTLRARALGMSRTVFANASGLPAANEWTTAHDMAMLARHLIYDFPNDYHYFSTASFVFRGQTIYNHDTMLKIYPGVDGMKTGYIDASGHNLVTSAVRDGVRLIGVEFGASTNASRDVRMISMLNTGFETMDVPIGRSFGKPHTVLASAHFNLIASAHAATIEHAARVVARAQPVAGAWSVQVGVYVEERSARQAAFVAHRFARGGEPRVEPIRYRGRRAWRAEIAGLTAPQARGACVALKHHHSGCLVLKPITRVLASR